MSNNNGIVAINEAEIDKKMLDVIDCSNKIKTIFNKIDDAVDRLKTYYKCSSANILYNQYEQLNDNYSVIVNNILSYNSDLVSLKKKYKAALGDLSQKINVAAANMEASRADYYKEGR